MSQQNQYSPGLERGRPSEAYRRGERSARALARKIGLVVTRSIAVQGAGARYSDLPLYHPLFPPPPRHRRCPSSVKPAPIRELNHPGIQEGP